MRQHDRAKRSTRRTRRGATIVFVAFLAIGLVGMGALAVDISRMYGGVAELQTVADAAALRAAQHVQRFGITNLNDSVNAFASKNIAIGGAANITTTVAYWRDPDTTLITSGVSFADSANAIQVVASRTAPLIFGGVLRSLAPVPARRAVAWIANASSSTCIKPWGMPMPDVLSMVGANPSPTRPLTQAEVAILRGLTQDERTVILAPPYSGAGQVPAATPNGEWALLRINGNGISQYQDAVEDSTCSNSALAIGDVTKDKPGNNIDTKTTASIDVSLCVFKSGSDTCYDNATTTVPGVGVITAFVPAPTSNGTETLVVKMIGKFVLLCYRQSSGGNNTCASTKISAATWKGYSEGTLLGYIAPDFLDLGGNTQLGNTVSTSQRLILVK